MGGRGKRIFDFVVGAALLVVAVPIMIGLAAALAITLRAWPFFLQERIGQHGRPFRMLKLRTLPPSTPAYALKDTLDFESLPWVARELRRTHLDELPQLWNVVTGKLSLVGPRPKMPDAHEPAPAEYVRMRQAIPQGCTGLWQIGREADALPHEAPEYDYFYLANRSLRLDAWILWRTILITLQLKGGVGLESIPSRLLASRPVVVPAPPVEPLPRLTAA